MKLFSVSTLKTSLLSISVALAAYSSAVLALEPGCNDINKVNQPRIQPNSTVDIVVGKAGPAEYQAALQQAIDELTTKIDGITLRLVAEEGANASIIVNVESTHIKDVGNYRGWASSTGWMSTGVLNIYKDQSGPECSGLCLDPAASGYHAAIKSVFVHELLHALGADHSAKANVMLSYFAGKNNKDNPNMNLPCVVPHVNSILAHWSPTDPGYCT